MSFRTQLIAVSALGGMAVGYETIRYMEGGRPNKPARCGGSIFGALCASGVMYYISGPEPSGAALLIPTGLIAVAFGLQMLNPT